MRAVTTQTTDAWQAAFKGGANRPMMRATIQKLSVSQLPYDLASVNQSPAYVVGVDGLTSTLRSSANSTTLSTYGGTGKFRSIMFGQAHQPIELPNMAGVTYSKSIDTDADSCTITLFNTEILPLGELPPDDFTFDLPGWFSPNRGETAEAQSRWGYAQNGWKDIIVPDRVIRLFEGYGFDIESTPEADEHLYPAGVWMIDDVTYTADGKITLSCRSLARALLDHIMFPPIVPFTQYPAYFQRYYDIENPDVVTTDTVVTTGSSWFRPTYDTDSNIPYIGRGFTDGGRPYVESDGEVLGHGGRDAFDSSNESYWMSVGNLSGWSSAFEFVQGKFSQRKVGAVRIKTWGGPYRMYISVWNNDANRWRGRNKIPYVARVVDTGADIRFVKSVKIGKGEDLLVKLPRVYAYCTKIRITFTNLYNSGIGYYKYRAGVRDFEVLKTTAAVQTISTTTDGGTHVEGNYSDYTDIVKWLCAWAGFFWPTAATGQAYQKYADGSTVTMGSAVDSVLGTGAVWGDLEQTGTNGPATLGYEVFDKKPVMDGINYIRDIVSYLFMVDETGGVIWRSPNIWQAGNYLSDNDGGPSPGRTGSFVTIDESETLLGLQIKISSRNVREKIFVANTTGHVGAVVDGYNPQPSGMERVSGWTDQHFETNAECVVMADLIAARQRMTYRVGSLVIPGYPAIQQDDQVKIMERTTSETFIHYVRSINCDWDLKSGQYHYNLETHWLGESPSTNWAVMAGDLQPETQAYLDAIGVLG